MGGVRFTHPGGDLHRFTPGRSARLRALREARPTDNPKVKVPAPSDRALLAVVAVAVHEYRGVTYLPGQRYHIDPLDMPGKVTTKQVQILEDLPPAKWWDAPGRILVCEPGEATPYALGPTEGALKIVQGTGYDPGNAAYRFHSAVNEYSAHCSAFVRYIMPNNNPFRCPTQYDAVRQPLQVRSLLMDADVLHCHVDYILPRNVGLGYKPRPGQLVIRHYHGTVVGAARNAQYPIREAALDDALGVTLVGARLTLVALRPGRMHWLPITVPVARYRAMADAAKRPYEGRPFRVAHSPTKSSIKGTKEFLSAIKFLKKKGLNVEAVLIERMYHREALAMKATADACFDSFWLGIQGSGLEAGAMNQPVIAGDPDVRALYEKEFGACPYTYANDAKSLMASIERLATDPTFYANEQRRVSEYVTSVHDYPAVAARYDAILRQARA